MLSNTIHACLFILLISTLVRADVNSHQYSSLDFKSIEDQAKSRKINVDESDTEYWMQNAQHYLEEIISDSKIMSMSSVASAKNIVFFLGDGMSLATVAAARMYLGGEEKSLSFEKFRHFGLSKTYCVDKQVADSACSSTAYLSGVKANYGTMGLTAKIPLNSCTGQNIADEKTVSIAGWAQKKSKSTGLVTTSKLTDATPGGLYSNIANRYWENDIEVKKSGCEPLQTVDIARQFVENDVSKRLKIVLACGREEFRDRSVYDEESIPGKRGDRRDLINEWVTNHEKEGKSRFVHDKKGLQSISNDTEYVLGLFGVGHCPYNIDIESNAKMRDVKPMLSEMTHAAIKYLQKNNENGYFLFVESARIDTAHHENWAGIALDETKEFSKAIEIARNITDEKDTLIVVTSDHAHTMSYNGYTKRGSDILGLSESSAADGLPYTTLSYANGLGYYQTYDVNGGRIDLSKYNLSNPRHRFPATVPLTSETHGGEDVGIYAHGPQSHLFVGNYEQSYIPMVMAYIAEIGPFAETDQCFKSSASITIPAMLFLPVLLSLQHIHNLLI